MVDANVDLIWRTADRLLDGFFAMIPLLVAALVVFLVLLFLAKGVRYFAERALARTSNRSAATAIGRILYILLLGTGRADRGDGGVPEHDAGRLISTLGIGGIAIGFAFKDIFQNLLAGILLLLRHPFRVGDEITTGEFTGTVEAIETRATFIRTYDGRRVIIPNGDVYTKPVTVISAYDMLRTEYDVGIGYGDDLGTRKGGRAGGDPQRRWRSRRPTPDVLVWELGESSKNIRLRWWTQAAACATCFASATRCSRPWRRRSPARAWTCRSRHRSCCSTIRRKRRTATARVSAKAGRRATPRPSRAPSTGWSWSERRRPTIAPEMASGSGHALREVAHFAKAGWRTGRGAARDDFGMVASSIAFSSFLSLLPLLALVALAYGTFTEPQRGGRRPAGADPRHAGRGAGSDQFVVGRSAAQPRGSRNRLRLVDRADGVQRQPSRTLAPLRAERGVPRASAGPASWHGGRSP